VAGADVDASVDAGVGAGVDAGASASAYVGAVGGASAVGDAVALGSTGTAGVAAGAGGSIGIHFVFISSTSAITQTDRKNHRSVQQPTLNQQQDRVDRDRGGDRERDCAKQTPAATTFQSQGQDQSQVNKLDEVERLSGYGKSKWVGERLVEYATLACATSSSASAQSNSQSGTGAISGCTIRLGMVGPCSETGLANPDDWITRMICAVSRGCIMVTIIIVTSTSYPRQYQLVRLQGLNQQASLYCE
jgi:hypothetical protein